MNYFIYLLICLVAHPTLASPNIERDYQIFEMHGKQGIKDNEGNVLIPAEYEALGWSRGQLQVVKNVVGFKKNDLWGIVSLQNEVISSAKYAQLYPADHGMLVAGVGKVSQHNLLGLLSAGGAVMLPYKFTSIKIANLRAIVSEKRGRRYVYGVVDLRGKTIIPVIYKQISSLGSLRFAVTNFDGKTAIYNDNGEQVIGFNLDSISVFNHGLAVIYDNHLRGLINLHGQLVMPLRSKNFYVSDTSLKSLSFPSWHIIAPGNKVLAKFQYDRISSYGADGLMKVEANNKQWLINGTGKAVTPKFFDELGNEVNKFIPFRLGAQWGVIKRSGELLLPAQFDSLFISEDMIYAREKVHGKSKWSLYDTVGIEKSGKDYDLIRNRSNYLFAVKRQHHWGFIDRAGNEVISCVYDSVGDFKHGYAVVKFHGEYGVIDKTAQWIVLPQKAAIELINENYFLTRKDRLTSLRSFEEGTIYFTENKVEVKDQYLLEYLSGGGFWKIDFHGRILSNLTRQDRYEEVRPPSEGFYAVKIDGKYGFVDGQNRLRIANRYDEVGPFKEGLAAINLLGHWGFINKREQLVVQPIYNSPSTYLNGLAIVEKNAGMGLITPTGVEVCSFKYDHIDRQENGRFLVEMENRFGLIGKNGELLVNAKYEELRDLNNGFAIIKRFGKYGLIDINGVDVIPVIYDQLYFDSVNDKYLGMKKSFWEDVTVP